MTTSAKSKGRGSKESIQGIIKTSLYIPPRLSLLPSLALPLIAIPHCRSTLTSNEEATLRFQTCIAYHSGVLLFLGTVHSQAHNFSVSHFLVHHKGLFSTITYESVNDLSGSENTISESIICVRLDISAFTSMCDKYCARGLVGGNELLSVLDEYISSLVQVIHSFDGDVLNFAGDAIFACWELDTLTEPELRHVQLTRPEEVARGLADFSSATPFSQLLEARISNTACASILLKAT